MTVGLDGAAVENVLGAGEMSCPVLGCGGLLGPWGWARERVVRGAGRLRKSCQSVEASGSFATRLGLTVELRRFARFVWVELWYDAARSGC